METSAGAADARMSQVQFATFMSYAKEGGDCSAGGDTTHTIHIVRSGALDTECSVDWFTDPDNKFANSKFKATRQTVTFKPNECLKKVELGIIDNSTFDNVVELLVMLDNPRNCAIVKDLSATRVKIIDDDVFPTEKFKNEILTGRTTSSWKDGQDFPMLIEIAKFLWLHNKKGATKVILADFLENLIFIVDLELGRRIVQCLAESSKEDMSVELPQLVVYASVLVFLHAFLHASSYFRNTWGVGGSARKVLLLSLMERFLYFEEASRGLIDTAQFRLTFAQDVFHLVSSGYMKMFQLVKSASRTILIALYFQVLAARRYLKSDGEEYQLFETLIPIALVPLLLGSWVALRERASYRCREETVEAQVDLMNHMRNCVDNCSLVVANAGRPMAMSQCEEKVNTLNKRLVQQSLRRANDDAVFGWLSVVVEFSVIVLGGYCVINGDMKLGTFTALLKGITSYMSQYRVVYATLMEMQSTYPGIWHLVGFINHPVDLKERFDKQKEDMRIFEERIASDRGSWTESLGITLKDIELKFAVEEIVSLNKTSGSRLGVEVENSMEASALKILRIDHGLVKDYNDSPENHSRQLKRGDFILGANSMIGNSILIKHEMEKSGKLNLLVKRATTEKPLLTVDLTIPTGKLVAITGPASCGMGTLLKMISGLLLPDPGVGEIFLPPHLRILHFSYKEHLWTGPIGESVFFGSLTGAVQGIHLQNIPEDEIKRGIRICRMLKIPENVIDAIQGSLDDHDDREFKDLKTMEKERHERLRTIKSLSSTTICKMQLAAALIDDPDVLVIDKALSKFSLEDQEVVIHLLQAFVGERGLCRPEDEYLQRRPRTCVFSSTTPLFLSSADKVYEVTQGGRVRDCTEGFGDREDKSIGNFQEKIREGRRRSKEVARMLVRKLSKTPPSQSEPESQRSLPPLRLQELQKSSLPQESCQSGPTPRQGRFNRTSSKAANKISSRMSAESMPLLQRTDQKLDQVYRV